MTCYTRWFNGSRWQLCTVLYCTVPVRSTSYIYFIRRGAMVEHCLAISQTRPTQRLLSTSAFNLYVQPLRSTSAVNLCIQEVSKHGYMDAALAFGHSFIRSFPAIAIFLHPLYFVHTRAHQHQPTPQNAGWGAGEKRWDIKI
jgi:hypothetical protein